MAAQRLIWRFSSLPIAKAEHRPPLTTSLNPTLRKEMSTPFKSAAAASTANSTQITRKLPILLFDVLDTIVRDPFYDDVPAFFGYSFPFFLSFFLSILDVLLKFVVIPCPKPIMPLFFFQLFWVITHSGCILFSECL